MFHAVRLIASLCLILIFTLSVSAQTELPSLRISVNGKPAVVDSSSYIQTGQTVEIMAPLRTITDALSASVNWEEKSKSIIVSKSSKVIRLQVDNRIVLIGDQQVEMPIAPMIIDGRTFVPLRFMANALGAKIQWDSNLQEINLMTDDYMSGKIIYSLSHDNDQVKLIVENISLDPIEFNFNSSQEYDFTLSTSQGKEIWRWSKGRMFNLSTHNLVLNPGEKYQVAVTLIPPSAIDKYTLNAYFLGQTNPEQPVQTMIFSASNTGYTQGINE